MGPMNRSFPRCLMIALALLAVPIAKHLEAQTLPDSIVERVRELMVRSRGANRQAENYDTQILNLLPPPPGPAAVLDWRTGEWDVLAAGYRVLLDIDRTSATAMGVTAPISAVATGDTLRVRLTVPGYETGLLELVHAEGRMIGTVTYQGIPRPASAQRSELRVVRTVTRSPCTFAQYTDGSWGVRPYDAACHTALDSYAGPFRYVAREYTP